MYARTRETTDASVVLVYATGILKWSVLLEPGQEQRAKKGHNRYIVIKLPLLGFNSAASMLTPGKGGQQA